MRLPPPGAHITGALDFLGENLLAKSERDMQRVRGRQIGMVFQEPMTALNPVHTIGRQVAESFRIHLGLTPKEALAEAAERLRRVGLPPDRIPLDRYPHQLSGGQRQRVVTAIAAALEPRLILADEPTTALDATARGGVIALLAGLARDGGAGLVFVTHDLAAVAGIADRILFMHRGEIVEEGRAPAIFRHLTHPYAQSLLAASVLPPIADDSFSLDAAPVLRAQDVSVTYGNAVKAVDGITLDLTEGESLAIVGESGSGKSTLARAILGLEPLAAGSVKIGSVAIHTARGAALRNARRTVQAVFQDPYGSLNPRHTVARIVAEPLHLLDKRLTAIERRARIAKVLSDVGLPADAGDRYPHEFSGGQRQRIAIARALISQPSAIVLDEAVSALDVTTRAQIIALLRDLSQRMGLAYIFITHDLDAARAVANRIVVMRHGRIVEQGVIADVLRAPAHAYTRDLIEASPTLETVLTAREASIAT
jgi:peptide/nickel transport system ATP-binding protein